MVQWWAAALIALGFAVWSVLCVLVGAGLITSQTKKRPDPRLN